MYMKIRRLFDFANTNLKLVEKFSLEASKRNFYVNEKHFFENKTKVFDEA